MYPNQHTNQSDSGTGRPMAFISTRLLRIQLPSLHIAICGPGENADYVPGQLPFGSMLSATGTDNESAAKREG